MRRIERIFNTLTTNKGLIYSIYEDYKSYENVTDSLTEKWATDLNRGFTKEEI